MRDAIFVVGAGRTGSSALTRVLGLCGGAVPLTTLPPNFGNPTGYWEPALAVALNDRVLAAHGSSWYDPSLRLQTEPLAAGEAEQLVREAALILSVGFQNDGPIVVKDPRITGLLPYWMTAAERAGMRTVIVHNFRDPGAVAASLARRDGLPRDASDALWLKYNLIAERQTRERARIFVSYDELLDDWEAVVRRCAGELGVALTVSEHARFAVGAFLSAGHRHHVASAAGTAARTDLANRTYAALRDAQRGHAAAAVFDALFAEFASAPAPVS